MKLVRKFNLRLRKLSWLITFNGGAVAIVGTE